LTPIGVSAVTSSTLPPADAPAAALVDVRAVAALLDCSARHVYRLSDAGRMPPPVRLGSLVRWRRADVEDWIADGCRPCRTGERG
jgi:excisionase family DNA binding protein